MFQQLINLGVTPGLSQRIRDFLADLPQKVRINHVYLVKPLLIWQPILGMFYHHCCFFVVFFKYDIELQVMLGS